MNQKYRWLCFVMTAQILAAWCPPPAASQEGDAPLKTIRVVKRDSSAKPNVILITVADVGFCDLACYGNRFLETPNISWLHKNSIRLNNYHASMVGAPTAASLLTGRYPERMGVWRDAAGRNILRFGELTLPELLKRSGYRTAVFGKWNLGTGDFYSPEFRGFDESLILPAAVPGQTPDFWGNVDDSPVLRHNGKPVKTRGNIHRTLFASAKKFASKQDPKPFFIYLPVTACAPPCRPTEKYLDQLIADGLEEETARFYALLREFDDHLGDLLKSLGKSGRLSDTILIFTSENGSPHAAFNKIYSGGKGSPLEGGHRVPFFIFWPRELQKYSGKDIQRLTAHIDVTPTILDLCGIKTDRRLAGRFDGVSFRPLLLSAGEAWFPRTLFLQPREVETFSSAAGAVVMNEKYRFLEGRKLYDIQKDPRQLSDVSGSFPGDVKTLEKLYKKWFEDVVSGEGTAINPVYVACGLTFQEKMTLKNAIQTEVLQREGLPTAEARQEILRKTLAATRKNNEKNPSAKPGAHTLAPTALTCYDWRLNTPLTFPGQLASLTAEAGAWDVEFVEAGKYEFTLRIAPENVPRRIPAATAFLQVDKKSYPASVSQDVQEVKILAEVQPGPAKIRALFQGPNGSFGAYFVYIRKIR